jgi:hypothetical protein
MSEPKQDRVVILAFDRNVFDRMLAEELMNVGFNVYIARSHDFSVREDGCYVKCRRISKVSGVLVEGDTSVLNIEEDVAMIKTRASLPTELDDLVRLVNNSRLRTLSSDKIRQYELLKDFMPETVVVECGGTTEFVRDDELVVVKANNSFGKKLVKIRNGAELDAMLEEVQCLLKEGGRADERIVVQKYMQGDAWQGLKSSDDYSNERLKSEVGRELRVYVFAASGDLDMFAVARLVEGDQEQWIYLDQTSIAEGVWDVSREAAERILKDTGSDIGYFVVDVINDCGNIMIREVNTRDPLLVSMEENHLVAKTLREKMAKMISIAVERNV